MSCFLAVAILPDFRVAVSKCGGFGILRLISSIGKYSLEGRPPPKDINPAEKQRKLLQFLHQTKSEALPLERNTWSFQVISSLFEDWCLD